MNNIDIILPVYNAEKYLSKCLDSIFNQSFQNFRLIAVDDGSTDTSNHILQQYAKKYSNLLLLTITNGGVSNARNLALSYIEADFVCFIDADDYLEVNYLSDMMNETTENYELIISGYTYVSPESEKLLASDYSLKDKDSFFVKLLVDKAGYRTALWNKLFNRQLLVDEAMTFDTSLAIGEDLVFLGEYLSQLPKIKIIPNRNYNYLINQFGTMKSIKTDKKNPKWHTEWLAINQFQAIFKDKGHLPKRDTDAIVLKKLIIANKLLKYTEDKKLIREYKKEIFSNIWLVVSNANLSVKNKLGILIRAIITW